MYRKALLLVTLALGLSMATAAADEDAYIELLRSDVRSEKVAIITEVMEFTDTEAERFWPVYRAYDEQLQMIVDDRIKMIKDFAQNYGTFTDRSAEKIAEKALRLESRRTNLKRKFYPRFSKAVGAKRAAQFFQLERQINLLIELQVASELPLLD
ncbi:MAG: hypothetical protein PVF33_11025 [Candidatus Latescibacterota bacterium]|jgi:hypothetical protein